MSFVLKSLTVIVCLLSTHQSLGGGFSDIDLAVRESLYNEFADGESCLDFYEDIFDLEIFKQKNELCDLQVVARVRLHSCFSSQSQPVQLEALVCLERDDELGYIGHFVEAWYED
jgi:hypothetical protein